MRARAAPENDACTHFDPAKGSRASRCKAPAAAWKLEHRHRGSDQILSIATAAKIDADRAPILH
jgi:hypothetical protein